MSDPYGTGGGSYSGRGGGGGGESSGGAVHSFSEYAGLGLSAASADADGGGASMHYHHPLPPIHYITDQLLVTALPERRQRRRKTQTITATEPTDIAQAATQQTDLLPERCGSVDVDNDEDVLVAVESDLSDVGEADDENDDEDEEEAERYREESLSALACFLKERHSFLVFSLADELPEESFVNAIDRQVVRLPWQAAGAPMSEIPTVGTLLHICYALSAWLGDDHDDDDRGYGNASSDADGSDCSDLGVLDDSDIDSEMDENSNRHNRNRNNRRRVAVVSCANGRTRTALACACFLHFAGKVENGVRDGFCHFCVRTFSHHLYAGGGSQQYQHQHRHHHNYQQQHQLDDAGIAAPACLETPLDVWKELPPTLLLLLHNFEEALELKGYMQPKPLCLRAIALQGVPVEQKPCLDLWDGRGRHVYSSHDASVNANHNNESDGNDSIATSALPLPSSHWADEEGFYKVNVMVQGDFCLLCRFGGTTLHFPSSSNVNCPNMDSDSATMDPTKILFRYVNTTGFLCDTPTALELPLSRVDVMRRYAPYFDPNDFLLSILWEKSNSIDTSSSVEISQMQESSSSDHEDNGALTPIYNDAAARQEGWYLIWKHHVVGMNTPGWDDLVHDFVSCDAKLSNQKRDEGGVPSPPDPVVSLALCLANCDPLEARFLLLRGRLKSWWKSQRNPSNAIASSEPSTAPQQSEGQSINGIAAAAAESGAMNAPEKKATEGEFSLSRRRLRRRLPENDSEAQTVLSALDSIDISPFVNDTDLAMTQSAAGTEFQLDGDQHAETNLNFDSPLESAIMNPNPGDVQNALRLLPHHHPGGSAGTFYHSHANANHDDPASTVAGANRPRVPVLRRLKTSIGETAAEHQQQLLLLASSPLPLDDPENANAVEILMQGLHHAGVTLHDLVDLVHESREWNLLEDEEQPPSPNDEETREAAVNVETGEAAVVCEAAESCLTQSNPNEAKQCNDVASGAKEEPQESASHTTGKDEASSQVQGATEDSDNATLEDNIDDATEHKNKPMKQDPRFEKYWKMNSIGIPEGAIRNAIRRDGKDDSIWDLDWEKNYEEQTESPNSRTVGPPMKEDERFEKYWKMKSVRLPDGAIRNAMLRDGLDGSIFDLDWEKSYEAQTKTVGDDGPPIKDDPRFKKYWKMKGIGIPDGAIRNAMLRDGLDGSIFDLDWEKNYEEQTESTNSTTVGPPMKEDERFEKYWKMKSVRLPDGAIRNAMLRDGLDGSIFDLDWEKNYEAQTKTVGDDGPPIKDDPRFEKYWKMKAVGIPEGAIRNAMLRDGADASVLELNWEKSLVSQTAKGKDDAGIPLKDGKPSDGSRSRSSIIPQKRVRRKKIFWKPIDPGQIKEDSLWSLVKGRSMNLLKYDAKEFDELFTESTDPNDQKSKKKAASAGKAKAKKAVQVIDGKRSMNGGIILLRLRMEYKKIASIVDAMDHGTFDSTQLKALKDFLPTNEERQGLQSYMGKAKTDEATRIAFSDLSECEKYMYTMIDVPNAQKKFDCMLFREQFHSRFNELVASIRTLEQACDEVKGSKSLREILGIILIVVNRINTGGIGNEAAGFSLEALLKLNEAKAFDKKTSVLHYLVKLVKRNDESLLEFHKDLVHVREAQNILLDNLLTEIKDLRRELESVHKTAEEDADQLPPGEKRAISLKELKEQITLVRCIADVNHYNQTDHVTGRTPMERFAMNAAASIETAMAMTEDVNQKYEKLLEYFGEEDMASSDFFGTMNRFLVEFSKAISQVEREEKAQLRRMKNAASSTKKFVSPKVKRKDAVSIREQPSEDSSTANAAETLANFGPPVVSAETAVAGPAMTQLHKTNSSGTDESKTEEDEKATSRMVPAYGKASESKNPALAKKPRVWARSTTPTSQERIGIAAAAAAMAISKRSTDDADDVVISHSPGLEDLSSSKLALKTAPPSRDTRQVRGNESMSPLQSGGIATAAALAAKKKQLSKSIGQLQKKGAGTAISNKLNDPLSKGSEGSPSIEAKGVKTAATPAVPQSVAVTKQGEEYADTQASKAFETPTKRTGPTSGFGLNPDQKSETETGRSTPVPEHGISVLSKNRLVSEEQPVAIASSSKSQTKKSVSRSSFAGAPTAKLGSQALALKAALQNTEQKEARSSTNLTQQRGRNTTEVAPTRAKGPGIVSSGSLTRKGLSTKALAARASLAKELSTSMASGKKKEVTSSMKVTEKTDATRTAPLTKSLKSKASPGEKFLAKEQAAPFVSRHLESTSQSKVGDKGAAKTRAPASEQAKPKKSGLLSSHALMQARLKALDK